MNNLKLTGRDWLVDRVTDFTEKIEHVTPSQFNEENRFLPESVTSMPGYLRYEINPYMREIVDCFDVESPVRELSLKKGVQTTWTTALESGALYFMAHVKTVPMMYMTADKDLAAARVENNFLPMLEQSGFKDIIRSSDEGNSRKTGKTANHLQWVGGGYMVPFGAINAAKMRAYSMMVMLKDEIDAWPDTVGKDGEPDKLSDARCKGYWERRKIFRGSTPLLAHNSKIDKAFKKGDQRVYRVLCRACSFPQELIWQKTNKVTGKPYGFAWDLDSNGSLIQDSVRYHCKNCGHAHHEHDKSKLFAEAEGAHWHPTAIPPDKAIRSYHLPGMYSPVGMFPWYGCVEEYLESFDPVERKVKDMGKFQVFYNNVLAEPFEIRGAKITFSAVSAHRRGEFLCGQINNAFATEYAGGPVLFLTCLVDVHKSFLAVTVLGWAKDAKPFIVDYWGADDKTKKFHDDDCTLTSSPVWAELSELIEDKVYTADDGREYRMRDGVTFIDAGYEMATVLSFCDMYAGGVYPVLGRDRPAKAASIKEFSEFTTQTGTRGYKITVDHYKDRLAPVLRREWSKDSGTQKPYTLNAPQNISDKALKELTVEKRVEQVDAKGNKSYAWHRPGNARNELWDLLVYGHCAVEVIAQSTCVDLWELDGVDWTKFWAYRESMLAPPCKREK